MGAIHENDLEWTTLDEGSMRVRRKQLGEAADGEALGCSLYELPPGAESWPYHYHTANEEAIYVLDGRGTLRLENETRTIRPGTYLALPADASGGHKLRNDGEEPLRYLAVSTMREPDVTVYPDSEKVGVFVGSPPGGSGERSVHGYYRQDDDIGYWDGE